jgi:hypothetical protein
LNIQQISHFDTFSSPDLVVDWAKYLTEHEITFVKENMAHFASLYKPRPLKEHFTPEDENLLMYMGTHATN